MRYIFDHDLHIHSQISLCSGDPEQTTENILKYAEENNLKQICLTDHFWDETVPGASGWYQQQNYERISAAKPLPQSERVSFLFGCETDMNRFMTVGLGLENYSNFDFVIIPTTHLHMMGFTMEEKDNTPACRANLWSARLEAVLNMPLPFHKVGIAHLTCELIAPTREEYLTVLEMIPTEEMKRLFQKASVLGVGIELNSGDMNFADTETNIVLRPYRIAKECGCKFYCGSDAHHPEDFQNKREVFERAIDLLGLEEKDKFCLRVRKEHKGNQVFADFRERGCMEIANLLKGMTHCECGKEHICPIEHVIIEPNALDSLNRICENFHRILFVADQNTYQACGRETENVLSQKICSYMIFDSGEEPLIPDEAAIAQMENKLLKDTDLILGVGSGVINDLCKYVSFQQGLPYYIVATAPSMDGYASVGAALILKGMKVTLNAAPPKAIIADTNVLKNAPMEMLKAGYGDIIGKYSCLNDWKLSAMINDEYFCQAVYDMTYHTAERVQKLASGILNREERAVGALMEALVEVGISMSYVGNSRPASGSEHHFAHFFEITGILTDQPYLAHGLDVAYSSVVTAKLREKMVASVPKPRKFNPDEWEQKIRRIYLGLADEVIALQNKLDWYLKDNSKKVLDNWEEIRKLLKEAPTVQKTIAMLEAIGMDYHKFENLYGQAKIEDAILYAKDLKDRYTILWLYYHFFR